MDTNLTIGKIAFVGDYVPRRCGIATFTHDLRTAIANRFPNSESYIVAVNDAPNVYDYPDEARFEIAEQDIASYQRAADFIDFNDTDVVSLQHEYGIYGGGFAGSHILALLRAIRVPVVSTLHTVLQEPLREQARVLREIIRLSSRVVVMAEKGKSLLQEVYGAPEEKIDVIPHGIPDLPFVDPSFFKDQFGVEGKLTLLTFGLLTPNKGIENAIRALPDVVREFPNVVYLIVGATQPTILRQEGEAYRLSLEKLAEDLGVSRHVIFHNRFVEPEELKEFLGAADVYLTPYLFRDQITSGTLSYAFGCGKAVVSTPYWHAEELLGDGNGVLVPFGDSKALADQLIHLFKDEPRRQAMRKRAFLAGRRMAWSSVAESYAVSFQKARSSGPSLPRRPLFYDFENERKKTPRLRLTHLQRLTDSTGIFQHAIFSAPDFSQGYCVTDNARALLLTALLEETGDDSARVESLASTYAAFIHFALDPETARFGGRLGFDRSWLDDEGSEDDHGYALWALGTCVGRSRRPHLRDWAAQLFERSLPAMANASTPRACALALLGIHEFFRRFSGDTFCEQLRATLTARLIEMRRAATRPDWPWFEESLGIDNGKPPHALLLSGRWMRNQEAWDLGLESLAWLVESQMSENQFFRPNGTGRDYRDNGDSHKVKRRPIEAQSTISACLEAYYGTRDEKWLNEARKAFDWFLGSNELGLALYDPKTGGCFDELLIDRVNRNQGAESTLSFLIARQEMQRLQNENPAVDDPPPPSDLVPSAVSAV